MTRLAIVAGTPHQSKWKEEIDSVSGFWQGKLVLDRSVQAKVHISEINIAEAKAHLSKYARLVKQGQRFILCDRNQPFADGYLVLGIWYLVFGIWYSVFGIRYWVFGIWYWVFGIGYWVFGIWCWECWEREAPYSHRKNGEAVVSLDGVNFPIVGVFHVLSGLGFMLHFPSLVGEILSYLRFSGILP